MGQLPGGQQRLFYSFNLEDHVPAQHLLRSIDQCLDLSDLRAYLADFYSPIGRPSIDPELMVRMLVVGYCYGIRSERRLCEEVHLNLAYRWFCRLASALMMLASTAKPSPLTRPAAMQRRSTSLNNQRNRSLSRKRPWRFFEKVE